MPEQTTPGATPEPTGATPAAGQEGPVGATPDGQAAEPATGDAAALGDAGKAALDREREAREKAVRENRDLKARLKEIEEKDLPAADVAARRLAEYERRTADLERELQETRVRTAVVGAAARMGFADPSDAIRLLDHGAMEFDDNGEPKDIDKALKSLLAAKPYLASTAARPSGSADAGNAGSAPSGTVDMNTLIRRDVGRGSN